MCAHGCVVFDGDCVFCLRNTGARAGPTTVWALWTQDNRGLMAAIVPRPCAVCINPSSQWTQRSFGFHVFHWCVSCTSWCLQSHDPGLMTHLVAPLCVPGPEASWPRSAFPASYHRGEHKSRTPVTRFVDVRSEPPSHDGVSNLGYPRLLSRTGCRTSWSGSPFPKGAVEVVEIVAS